MTPGSGAGMEERLAPVVCYRVPEMRQGVGFGGEEEA